MGSEAVKAFAHAEKEKEKQWSQYFDDPRRGLGFLPQPRKTGSSGSIPKKPRPKPGSS